jgi:myo-inositol 2-dehydrogenase/D-chiro-inositol 1-dehydrogenase
MSRRVTVAVLGLGRIGAVHFSNSLNNRKFKIVAVVDPIEERRKDFAERGECKPYASLADALADASNPFEAVMVCTPTGEHPAGIRDSLNAGKHVFCEKPIAYDTKIVDEVYALAKQKGKILLCGFQRRHDPNFIRLKNMIDSGKIGTLHKVRTISRDNPCPSLAYLKISGGLIFDCSSHDCDEMRWLTGEDPVQVYAVGSAFLPGVGEIPDVDTLEIMFKFASGRLGSVDISRISVSGYDQRAEAHGDKGTAYAENEKDSTTILATNQGFLQDVDKYSFPTRYLQAYSAEVDHFANLCLGKETVPRLSHEDVHKNCLILHAANQSLQSGVPVKINYDTWKNAQH